MFHKSSIFKFQETKTKEPTSSFFCVYNKQEQITVWLEVEKFSGIFWYIHAASDQLSFNVTNTLDGQLEYVQNNTKRENDFISTMIPVNTSIEMRQSDLDYLKKKASYITVYWFENCVYIGKSNDFFFVKHYHEPNQEYEIEALVIASFEPLPGKFFLNFFLFDSSKL